MASKKKAPAPEPATSDTGPVQAIDEISMPQEQPSAPVLTAAEKRKQRAAAIKEANRKRLAKLAAEKAERKKLREAKAAAKPAKDAAEKAKAAKVKEDREASEKAIAEAQKALVPIAKEVNHRLEQAAKMDSKADDHRLAAALQLKDAEEKCKAGGVDFKAWSIENVKGYSFETVRQLVRVGKAPEPMLALEDMRAKNAARNRQFRERQKEELQEARQQKASAPAKLDDPQNEQEASEGFSNSRVDRENAPEREYGETELLEGLAAVKVAFGELKASEQMEFAEWAAREVGGAFHSPL